MLQWSTAWFGLLVDVSVKSLLLAVLAASALAVLRIRNVNARHRIWTAVLLGMIALPFLVRATPRVPLPGWMGVALIDTQALTESESDSAGDLSDETEVTGIDLASARPIVMPTDVSEAFRDSLPATFDNPRSITAMAEANEQPVAQASTKAPIATATTAGHPIVTWRQWFGIMAMVQVIVALFLLARIMLGLLLTWHLVRAASEVTESRCPAAKGVLLLDSEQLSVPVTIGFFRPKVILPVQWKSWPEQKLHSVLAHELAHIRRSDWLVALLSDINRAFHWFNPLAWFLRRQLADLAEQNCDDAVIEARGDRSEYARHLLEVASAYSTAGARYRLPPQLIAMARKPAVETRIDAILDDSRPLAKRLGWIGVVTMLAVAVPAILIAAGLTPNTDEDEEEARKSVTANAVSPKDSGTPFVYAGQVLTPDGKPAADAEIRLVYWYSDQSQVPRDAPDAVTDQQGRFRFEVDRSEFYRTGDSVPPWHWASLAATKAGYGLAWANSLAFEQTGVALQEMRSNATLAGPQRELLDRIARQRGLLRLATDDVPITGKVVSTEGQPISNVTIRLVDAYTGEDDTLLKWHEARQQPRADFYSTRQATPKHVYGPIARQLIPPVVTNAKGEFTLRGLGGERLVRLLLEAPTIESNDVYCRTEAGDKIRIGASRQAETMYVFASNVSQVVTPSKPITGVVRDEATGKPVAGVQVSSMELQRFVANGHSRRIGSEFSRTVTDRQGRYTLTGLPNAEGNPVRFVPPPDHALMSRMSEVDTTGTDTQPVELNADLVRGVLVTGRVVDRETGKGVSGQIQYLKANTDQGKGLSVNFDSRIGVEDTRSDTSGDFRIVVPQGKGFLTFRAFDDAYEKKAYRPKHATAMAATAFSFVAMSMGPEKPEFHATIELELLADATKHHVEMQVGRAPIIGGMVLGPDGKEIEGYYSGREEFPRWRPWDGAQFTVVGYDPKYARRLAFVSGDKKWSGTFVLKGAVTEPLTVKLQPSSTLTGRIVDEHGDPIPDLVIQAGNIMSMRPISQPGDVPMPDPILPLPTVENGQDGFVTGEDGRFTIEGLVGGMNYSLMVMQMTRGLDEVPIEGDLGHVFVFASGNSHDLGNVQIKKPDFEKLRRQFEEAERQRAEAEQEANERPTPGADQPRNELDATRSGDPDRSAGHGAIAARLAPAVETKNAASESTSNAMHITGRVLKPNGEPLADAKLYWPRTKTPQPMKLDDMYLQLVATSGRDGSFNAELVFPSFSWARKFPLMAIVDGFGMAWTDVTPNSSPDQLTLMMSDEFPISGRVLDTEGNPVPGATAGLFSLMADSSGSIDKLLTAWKSEWRSSSMKMDKVLHVGLPLVNKIIGNRPTDEQGRFTIRGLGKEHAVWINVRSPSIANRSAVVITRKGFEPDAYNQAALAQAGDMALMRRQTPQLFAGEVTIVAEPCKMILGQVTDIESGEPIEGVQVATTVGQGDAILSMTGADGKYQLTGLPINDDEVLVSFRKPQTRYLPRTLATRLTPGIAPMEFNAGLAMGVLLSGRVTETETGKPVSGGIRFAPLGDNAWKDKPGYDDYKRSRVMEGVDQDGKFEFVSIPGPGVLMMQAGPSGIEIDGQYVKPYRKGRFSEQDRQKVRIHVEGESFYTSASGIEFFENGMKVVDIPEDVEKYTANVTVDRGLDVDVAIVDDEGKPLAGTMVCGVTESWPITYPAKESKFRIYALDPKRPRRVIFYHQHRRLAGTLTLRGDEKEPIVARLHPTLRLVGRAVDADGEPLVGATVGVAWSDDTSREFQRQLAMTRQPITTGEDGAFHIEGALPGMFRLTFSLDKKRFSTEKKWDDVRTIASTLIAAGGSEIQLGDITVKQR